jgi:lysophospholipase L1-like esterase
MLLSGGLACSSVPTGKMDTDNHSSGGSASGGSTAGGSGSGGTAGSGGSVANGGSTGAAGGSDSGGSGGGGPTPLVNPRITLFGDSTTSDGCFRAHLQQMLTADTHEFTMVGTRSGNPGCQGDFDPVNEGHGGYIVNDLNKAVSTGRPGGADASDPYVSSEEDLSTWFDANPTDVVMMNFGTNDLSNAISETEIIKAYTKALTKLRSINPKVHLMVAQIPPISWQFCTFEVCDPRVKALNAAVATWATEQNTAESPVTAVDLYTGYDAATDTVDGVHTNESGSAKIATAWYNAIEPLY